jgi:hypothetical protein
MSQRKRLSFRPSLFRWLALAGTAALLMIMLLMNN